MMTGCTSATTVLSRAKRKLDERMAATTRDQRAVLMFLRGFSIDEFWFSTSRPSWCEPEFVFLRVVASGYISVLSGGRLLGIPFSFSASDIFSCQG